LFKRYSRSKANERTQPAKKQAEDDEFERRKGQEGFYEDEWCTVDALDDSFRFKEEQ
jgi:hypothetical protein